MTGYSALELGQESVREELAQAAIVHTTTSNCTPIAGWAKEGEDSLRERLSYVRPGERSRHPRRRHLRDLRRVLRSAGLRDLGRIPV
jgi:hypothetical protein